MKHSIIALYMLSTLFLSTQTACAQTAKDGKKPAQVKSPASICAPCELAMEKAKAISIRISSEGLVPDFKSKATIEKQRQVKYDISQILQDLLKNQNPQQKELLDTTLAIWKIGALYDEHYVIAENIYLSLKPAMALFYTRLAQLKAQSKGSDREAYQAIFDQMKAAESEYEEGNG